jgi:RNA polymerase sigma-70 factor (ECF subfamily)
MTEEEVAKLYARYGYVIFRRCMVYLGDPKTAQVAVQDVFVRALRATGGIPKEVDPRTWLCRLADGLCVDRLRHSRNNPLPVATTDSAGLTPAIAAAIANDDRESLLAVRELAAGLDPESFQLAVLHFVDELTPDELAQELGLARRNIDKRVRLLLQRARSLPQPESAS